MKKKKGLSYKKAKKGPKNLKQAEKKNWSKKAQNTKIGPKN